MNYRMKKNRDDQTSKDRKEKISELTGAKIYEFTILWWTHFLL